MSLRRWFSVSVMLALTLLVVSGAAARSLLRSTASARPDGKAPGSLFPLNAGIEIHREFAFLSVDPDNGKSDAHGIRPAVVVNEFVTGGLAGCLGGIVGGAAGGGVFLLTGNRDLDHLLTYWSVGVAAGFSGGCAVGICRAGAQGGQDGSFGYSLLGAALGLVPGLYLYDRVDNLAPAIICPLLGGVVGYNASVYQRAHRSQD
jgi:hypothetical protein